MEVSHDQQAKKWLIRIHVGAEVIRRHRDLGRNADEAALRSAAVQVAADEGYSVDPSEVVIA